MVRSLSGKRRVLPVELMVGFEGVQSTKKGVAK